MKRWSPLILAVLLLALGAFATNIVDVTVYQALFRPWSRTTTQLSALTPSAWTGYVAYNSTTAAMVYSNGTAWTGNGFNSLPLVGTTYDFPPLVATAAAGGSECVRSWDVVATGAVLTDACQASSNFGVDGGSVMPGDTHVTCTVSATGVVVFDACAQLGDGGTRDLADAGYYARITH